jgi:hypothetical protein
MRSKLCEDGLRILAVVLVGSLPSAAISQGVGGPIYLNHRTDPVQQIYSRASLGFSINQKCRFLSDLEKSDYESRLIQAGGIFQGYVVAQKIVPVPGQAIDYIRDMTLGSDKFASSSECDAASKDLVQSGHSTARDFVPLLRALFEAPSHKQ